MTVEPTQSPDDGQATERQLTMLIEASSTLLTAFQSADVVDRILMLARRFIDADAYSVWRRAASSGIWSMVASEGISGDYARSLSDTFNDADILPAAPVVIEKREDAPFRADRTEAWTREGIASLITVPLRIRGELSGTIVFYYRTPHRFSNLETRVAAALGNLAAAALQTSELYQREIALRQLAQAEERKANFLAEAGQLLSSSLDYEATLTSVVDLAVPRVADLASISILEPTGQVRRVAAKHRDPEKMKLADEYGRRFPSRDNDATAVAMRSGKSVLVAEISPYLLEQNARDADHLQFMKELGLTSLIIAPLMAGTRTFGYLTFVSTESGRRYTVADQSLAEELARRAATAIDNARLYEESNIARSALERTNAELQRSNEDLNQFAFSVSHDLKGPLRMVAIYSQMLKRKYESHLDADGREYLGHILHGVQRMDILLHDLLAYTKTMDDRPDGEPEPIDLGSVAQKVLASLQPLIAETNAHVSIHALPTLRVQPSHFWQLLQNLLENALKYRGENAPEIEVGACPCDASWSLYVRDNGIGVPPEFAGEIFGLFKRLHSNDRYEGTGLGLAICQRIVERYHGRIWVESDGATGSKFCFTLPAAQ